nr:DUF6631 family protein [uncultured Enterobacter sp.]
MSDNDDLAILFPSRELLISGKSVTVHEYTIKEQLQHRPILKTLSDAFAELLDGLAPDGEIPLDSLMDLLAKHESEVIQAVALSTGQSADWVAELAGPDSDSLLLTWWGVNAGFFTRAAVRPAMEKMVRQIRHHAGAKSSAR